eukprot:3257239-Prymnesium_polylepis.1
MERRPRSSPPHSQPLAATRSHSQPLPLRESHQWRGAHGRRAHRRPKPCSCRRTACTARAASPCAA